MSEENVRERISKALELFAGPYNCSQSVAAAFSDILGKEDEEIFRLMSGFGFGMGGERSVCGAISGGIFVLSSTIADPTQREELYDKVYYMVSRFKKQNGGHMTCLGLVGENPASEEFQNICPKFIEQVVREIARILNA